ncbi:DUF3857 domain-containing protein [Sphingomonas adhaesiva]|uniref:DUF3857 domain-containing protein n=1 Tax=Sphingomonas adhaesiva TaxID=28212 RepID=UPI002FF77061
MRRAPLFFALLASAAGAHASDTVRYAPAAAWVTPAPAIAPAQLAADAPVIVLMDTQARLSGATTDTYVDAATRVATEQLLTQLGNVSIPWMPDRGDLTVHRVEILRAGKVIDLLAGGQRFTAIRREQQMEQNVLTGMMTATLPVAGLQLGDVLRVSFTIGQSDKALGGHTTATVPTPPAPFRAGFARSRLLWPKAEAVRWKGYGEGLTTSERDLDGMHEVTAALPLPKPTDMPDDLPTRLVRLPVLEAASFADWADVSRTMAPLYATAGLIAPGSPLDGEVKAIAAAESDPLRRAQRALELVQGKIRYLAVAMDGGGLTPQPPATTWELRYGDCKAKTLLLLAMLHALGVEAEPAIASVQTGGLVTARLPSAAAFDHILVRATVAGETLWLDGTGLGARLDDIRDVPPFHSVLPLRTAGTGLETLPQRADARPERIVELTWDQRAGLDFPATFDARITLRGRGAEMIATLANQADAEQKREWLDQMIASEAGEAQFSAEALRYDPVTATVVITGSGIASTGWWRQNRRYRRIVDRAVGAMDFAPDRARQAWRELPVATGMPGSTAYRTVMTLPDGGAGFELEGARTLPATLAGRQVRRTVALTGATLTIEDRVDAVGAEIAPAALAGERARYAQAKADALRVLAPVQVPTRVEQVVAARKDGRFARLEQAFAAAIARDPKEETGYISRASFRSGIYDVTGAVADLTRAIDLKDSVELRLRRAALFTKAGKPREAIADYEAARALEPDNDGALIGLANARARTGDRAAAYALLDERIARGDRDRFGAVVERAELLALEAKPAEGVALVDAAIVERPGDPNLLNSRCWVKGLGNVMLDSALKDCTRSIELSDSPAAALDSRGLAYLRMGKIEEALADLDAAIELMPQSAGTLYLRGLARRRAGRQAEGAADVAAATLMDPQVATEFRRFGVTE